MVLLYSDLVWGIMCIVLVDCDEVCISVVIVCVGDYLVMVDVILVR